MYNDLFFLVIFVYKAETSLDIKQKNKEQLVEYSINRGTSLNYTAPNKFVNILKLHWP
jgi:hypothetical protein